MSRRILTRSLQVLIDLAVLTTAYALAFLFRFELTLSGLNLKLFFFTLPYVVLLQYVVLALFGVPAITWRHVGLRDIYRIGAGVTTAVGVLLAIRLGLAGLDGHAVFVRIPIGVLAIDFTLSFLGISGARVLRRIIAEHRERKAIVQVTKPKRTLLVGAGSAGSLVAHEINQRPDLGMSLVGFADDDPVKIGTLLQGAKVVGDTYSLPDLIERYKVEQVVITMGSVSSNVIRRLKALCSTAGIAPKIIPGLYEILDGRVNMSRLREVGIDDLLGREVVQLEVDRLRKLLTGRTIVVTGAGGSIGSELCRQVARLDPAKLLLIERAEPALFEIHSELLELFPGVELVPLICDVCDETRVEQIFGEFRPAVVLHAAAHKHVPMMEWNPGEAVKNNVLGTRVVADAADRHQVETFVLISTDKAVNPTSVMGCTKRVAELYVQSMLEVSRTKYVAVRFGNVLGSKGSVIPIFKKQLERGGPLTVTHPDMQRYFMTISEASQLVLQAGSMGGGGEIFLLDMGKPVKILQLARDLIQLSGYKRDEIPIEFTGVRPGEKLFEELSMEGENIAKTRHPRIFIGRIAGKPRDTVIRQLDQLTAAVGSSSHEDVRRLLCAIVPEAMTPAEAPLSKERPSLADGPRPRLVH